MRFAKAPSLAAVSMVLAGAGCSLLTPLEGFSTPSPGDGPEQQQQPGDAGLVEASSQPAADAASTFCSTVGTTPVFLCADFDGDSLPGSWQVAAAHGGDVALDPSTSRSSPRSLRVSSPGGPQASGDTRAAVTRVLPKIVAEIDVQFDVKAELLGAPRFDIFTIWKGGDALGLEIDSAGELFIDDDRLQEDGSLDELAVPIGRRLTADWRHIAFTSTRAEDGTVSSRLLVDGVIVRTHSSPAAPFADGDQLFIGDWAVTPLSAPWRVHFDNIVVKVR